MPIDFLEKLLIYLQMCVAQITAAYLQRASVCNEDVVRMQLYVLLVKYQGACEHNDIKHVRYRCSYKHKQIKRRMSSKTTLDKQQL